MKPLTPDLTPARASSTSDRRDFLRAAGLGGAALALAACGADRVASPSSAANAAGTGAGTVGSTAGPNATTGVTVTLDFSNDYGVLNYAYALEQLEAAFYAQVLKTPYSGMTQQEMRILTDLSQHEAIHREFLKTALGSKAIPGLTPNFTSIDFTSRASVIGTAAALEDTGVHAYNGAGHYIKSAAYLTIAGKIVSVEARHASAIHDLLSPRGSSFAPDVFDAGYTPQQVLAAAGKFVYDTINVTNA